MRPLLLSGCIALVGCGSDNEPHVFHTSAPAPASAAQARAAGAVPELPIGTLGAEAKITAVSDYATGVPVTLTNVTGAFNVMGLVGRGPGAWNPSGTSRLELRVRGRRDTVFALALGSPPPVVVAHQFEVRTTGGGTGLPAGNYTMQLVLIVRDTSAVAESVPLHFTVR